MTASPRPSATVVLARDTDDAPEFLFVRRRAGDAFGNAYTFPGGVLDDDEFEARGFCAGLTDEQASALLGLDEGGLDYFSAVVRELYEETGVLPGAPDTVDAGCREQLYRGELKWTDFLRQHDLSIPAGSLYYFTHWITPADLAKRWSTRFFLAAMPEGQEVVPDGSEITDYCWLSARAALDSASSGERKIPFPTRKTVETLAGHDTVDELLDWARQKQADGVPALQPEIRYEDGEARIFLPDVYE